MLSDLSPTNEERGVYETIEADREYEILDKYNQPYEDVRVPPLVKPKPEAEVVQPLSSTGDYEFSQCPAYIPVQPLSSTGDYEFSQCPAYITVATTSIHDSTSTKPMDNPTVQPPTAAVQDSQKDKIN